MQFKSCEVWALKTYMHSLTAQTEYLLTHKQTALGQKYNAVSLWKKKKKKGYADVCLTSFIFLIYFLTIKPLLTLSTLQSCCYAWESADSSSTVA